MYSFSDSNDLFDQINDNSVCNSNRSKKKGIGEI